MAIRYGVIIAGIAFYAFAITTLIKVISNYLLIPRIRELQQVFLQDSRHQREWSCVQEIT